MPCAGSKRTAVVTNRVRDDRGQPSNVEVGSVALSVSQVNGLGVWVVTRSSRLFSLL